MAKSQQVIREQQRAADLSSATLRALTGQNSLYFRNGILQRDNRRFYLHAPHLQTDPDQDDFISFRGITDSASLRLKFTDEELHRQHCPDAPIERLIFELLEQLRVESLAQDTLPGMVNNLRYQFTQWSRQFHHSRLSGSHLGVLLYTLAQMVWSRLNNQPVWEESEDFIEATRAGIAPLIGVALAGLKRERHDQAGFAQHALAIAGIAYGMVEAILESELNNDDHEEDETAKIAFHLLLDFDEGEEDIFPVASSGKSKAFAVRDGSYRIFSRQYDRQVMAAELVRADLLTEFRQQLDRKVAAQRVNIPRLARRLEVMFAVPEQDGWRHGEEEGYIDGRRLSQVISSPTERRLFQQQHSLAKANSLVTFLIDCSGSMKEHIESIAVLVDIFDRALDQAGVSSEILGFTTNAWNGGRPMQDWMQQGRPDNPGRLNEACFMVYKEAEISWRRARPNIASMLKSDLFREGIDGEAVEWACERMYAEDYQRRLLVVISDGCPMDTATNLANDKYYLDNHLKSVLAYQEQIGEVEIFALGVDLDLSPFYRRSLVFDLSRQLDNQMINEILLLLVR